MTQLIYANWSRYVSTPFDLSIDLGYNTEPGPPAKIPVRVTMSWEHAKLLSSLIQEAVEAYESQAGPIRSLQNEVEAGEESQ